MKTANFLKFDITCPLCRSDKIKQARNFGCYKIFDCKNCKGSFSWPMTAIAYENKELENKDFNNTVKKSLRRNFVYCFVSTFLQKISKQNILDVGAGQGITLFHAKRFGYKTYGTEVSDKTIKVLRDNCPFVEAVKTENFDNFSSSWPKKYDVISCLDVLEHTENPVLLLSKIKDKLNDDGFLIISLPNKDRYYYKLGGLVDDFVPKEHGGDNPPYHLTFWKKQTLEKILKRVGFDDYCVITGGLIWRKNIQIKGRRSFILSGLLKMFYLTCQFLPLFIIDIFEKWGTHLIVVAKNGENRNELKEDVKYTLKKIYKKQAPFFVDGEIE